MAKQMAMSESKIYLDEARILWDVDLPHGTHILRSDSQGSWDFGSNTLTKAENRIPPYHSHHQPTTHIL